MELEKEGTKNRFWYGTRCQTILLISPASSTPSSGEEGKKFKITMIEREAYVLNKELGVPEWSGKEKREEFYV